MLRSLTPEGFALAFCAANAGGALGDMLGAIQGATKAMREAPPAGLSPAYVDGFIRRNLPRMRLEAWHRAA